jgi:hypothetical protein
MLKSNVDATIIEARIIVVYDPYGIPLLYLQYYKEQVIYG